MASDAGALLLSSYYLSFSFATLFYPLLLFIFYFILNGRSPSVYRVQIFARISAILTQVFAVFLSYSKQVWNYYANFYRVMVTKPTIRLEVQESYILPTESFFVFVMISLSPPPPPKRFNFLV
jgi:hypothetical protein